MSKKESKFDKTKKIWWASHVGCGYLGVGSIFCFITSYVIAFIIQIWTTTPGVEGKDLTERAIPIFFVLEGILIIGGIIWARYSYKHKD